MRRWSHTSTRRLTKTSMGLAALVLFLAASPANATRLPGSDPVVAAAGDISCAQGPDGSTNCRDQATSDLLVNQGLARVLTLGDQQYESGALSAFNSYYDPTWGRVKEITSPAPGNHDPFTSGYSAYFGPRAPARYYSYDIAQWHLISLDSNNVDSSQVAWLESDLAANAGEKCVLAYWHHPRFSSGTGHGDSSRVAPFWSELYDANADLVLSGHEHSYERFAPQAPTGTADPVLGIRQFVVGTGGKSHYGFGTPKPTSEVRGTGTFGVLELALRAGSYEWLFVPEAGKTFTDSGTGVCHNSADLSITKSDSPDPLIAGQTLTYTLTARNDGPSGAAGVTVTDSLPAQVSYESASSSQGSCSEASGTVTCSLGTLASGATATATITVRHLAGDTITNTTAVQGTEADPGGSNNSDSESTTVTAVADLSLAKADSPDPVPVGGTLTYDLTAHNDGPSGATGVTLTDDLPAGVAYQDATPSQGTCSETGGSVTCSLGAISSGGSATVQVAVTPQSEGTITNSGAIQANESDPSTSNNTASADTAVTSDGYARPKAATPSTFRLVPAFVECTSANASHGPPLESPSCSPPTQASSFLTLNAPDRPAPHNTPANTTGVVTVKVFCTDGAPSPCTTQGGDQIDVKIDSTISDVRCIGATGGCSAAGGTYSGKLLFSTTLRITDKLSGVPNDLPGTVTDTPFQVGMQCSAGTCNISTSVDSVIPGIAQEGTRAIWQLSDIRVFDGGSDRDLVAAPAPGSGSCPPACTGNGGEDIFMRVGLFTP